MMMSLMDVAATENAKDTLCRNVLIYGHCRYEDQGCAFNHEPNKIHNNQAEKHVSSCSLLLSVMKFYPSQPLLNITGPSRLRVV